MYFYPADNLPNQKFLQRECNYNKLHWIEYMHLYMLPPKIPLKLQKGKYFKSIKKKRLGEGTITDDNRDTYKGVER